MISASLALWIFIAAIAVIAIAGTVLLLGRRRHVEIEAPTLDDPVVAPTLVRTPARAVATELPLPPPLLAPVESSIGASDDLLRLKGVGPRLATRLNDLGITRYDQIAAWTDDDIAAIDGNLGTFAGRAVRDRWVEQARYLAAEDIAGFEAHFGKIDGGA